jgi:toxin-antitoxin system PIN domain toxin
MIAVDTNILVTAHREDLPKHRLALGRLTKLAGGDTPWGVPVFCIGEFVRVVTHPRVFDPPSTLEEAIAALESLLKSPTLRIFSPGSRYPKLFAEALREADARGNLAFDAQIAAVCHEQGAGRLLTMDKDFARFRGLHLVDL